MDDVIRAGLVSRPWLFTKQHATGCLPPPRCAVRIRPGAAGNGTAGTTSQDGLSWPIGPIHLLWTLSPTNPERTPTWGVGRELHIPPPGTYDNSVVSVSWANFASASSKIVRPADSWVLSQISSTDSPWDLAAAVAVSRADGR